MIRSPFLCLTLGLALALAARGDTPPEPPYVAAMPNPGHWVCKPEAAAPAKPAAAASKPKEVSTETWLVGENRFDLISFDDQSRRERFLANGVCYESDGSKGGFYILDPRMDGSLRLPSVKEWAELAWIKPEAFKGSGTAEGYHCYVYEENTAEGPRRAMIEVTSRLPIAYEEKGIKYVYKYLTPTSELPKPEKALTNTLENYQNKLKSITVDRKPR